MGSLYYHFYFNSPVVREYTLYDFHSFTFLKIYFYHPDWLLLVNVLCELESMCIVMLLLAGVVYKFQVVGVVDSSPSFLMNFCLLFLSVLRITEISAYSFHSVSCYFCILKFCIRYKTIRVFLPSCTTDPFINMRNLLYTW